MKKSVKKIKPQRSVLEVVDIALADLVEDEDNPNSMDEATFDLLVEEIREEGFDEPIQVRPHPTIEDKFQISSGHHRAKAASVIGMGVIPAIIKHHDDRHQKISLVKRNVLRGEMDKTKLAKLYQDVAKGRDPATVQRELGFSDPSKIEPLIENAKKTMTPKQKKKLDEAKENIKTIDDLSSVLNRIFKESGSEAESGYMVFSFGGKDHHYIKIDDVTNKKLHALAKEAEANDMSMREVLQSLVINAELPERPTRVKKTRKPKRVN